MRFTIQTVVLFVATLLVRSAQATTINFDSLADGATVTNQFPGVVFSSSGGDVISVTAQAPPYLGSAPNIICTGTGGASIDCTHDVILMFSSPVSNLTFDAFGNQTAAGGTFAQADVYQNGILTQANLLLTVSHTVHCAGVLDCAADPQSLAFSGITELIIHNNVDAAGTAYDNFSFTVDAASAPEPGTLLFTGVFLGLVYVGRGFLARKV